MMFGRSCFINSHKLLANLEIGNSYPFERGR